MLDFMMIFYKEYCLPGLYSKHLKQEKQTQSHSDIWQDPSGISNVISLVPWQNSGHNGTGIDFYSRKSIDFAVRSPRVNHQLQYYLGMFIG